MKALKMKGGAIAHKAVCVFSAFIIAFGMCTLVPASTQTAYASESMSADGYVSCASYRAAEPAPEILGLSNIGSNGEQAPLGSLDWGAPYYYFFGTSEYNSNPNPYMVNAVTNANEKDGDASPSIVYYTRQGGPTASMRAYAYDEYSMAAWNLLPDTILGNSSGVNYNSADYSQAAATANDATDYKVYGGGSDASNGGVIYDSTNIYTMIGSMYDLAEAGTTAAEATGKSLRYGDANAIAADFEAYVKGTQGYVLEQLAANNADKKKVCFVYNYDAESETYQLTTTGVAEGTAMANRYLEATQYVATNIADSLEVDDEGYATATAEQVEACDLIMVGSQSGSENLLDTETLVASLPADVQQKTYWVTGDGKAGSCYGVVMNSVENAQNIGRILGCLYSEYIDQADWIAYYYQNFYHLKTDKIAEAVDNAMDGVRNWDAQGTDIGDATTWTTSTVADYSESAVQDKIDAGMAYLSSNASSLGDAAANLTPTDNYVDIAGTTTSPGDAEENMTPTDNDAAIAGTATASKASQTLKVAKKQLTKTVKASKVAKKKVKTSKVKVTGNKTKVTYKKVSGSKKLTVGSKGKITVKKGTAKGTYKVKVKVTAKSSTNYKAASKTVTVKVKVK